MCLHCNDNHKIGSVECPKQKVEQDICNIQNKMKVSWPRARRIYNNNPISKNSIAETIPLRKPTKIQPRAQHNNEK